MGHACILQEILAAVEGLDVPSSAREQFKTLVRSVGIANGVSGMARAEQVEYARRLIRAGVSRPTTRERLMALHGISRRQAYIVIDAAISCANSEHFSAQASDMLGSK